MNELQQKLARRRNLNGEVSSTQSSQEDQQSELKSDKVESNGKPIPSTRSLSSRGTTFPAAVASNSNSQLSELQKKLLRRRGLNGEIVNESTDEVVVDDFTNITNSTEKESTEEADLIGNTATVSEDVRDDALVVDRQEEECVIISVVDEAVCEQLSFDDLKQSLGQEGEALTEVSIINLDDQNLSNPGIIAAINASVSIHEESMITASSLAEDDSLMEVNDVVSDHRNEIATTVSTVCEAESNSAMISNATVELDDSDAAMTDFEPEAEFMSEQPTIAEVSLAVPTLSDAAICSVSDNLSGTNESVHIDEIKEISPVKNDFPPQISLDNSLHLAIAQANNEETRQPPELLSHSMPSSEQCTSSNDHSDIVTIDDDKSIDTSPQVVITYADCEADEINYSSSTSSFLAPSVLDDVTSSNINATTFTTTSLQVAMKSSENNDLDMEELSNFFGKDNDDDDEFIKGLGIDIGSRSKRISNVNNNNETSTDDDHEIASLGSSEFAENNHIDLDLFMGRNSSIDDRFNFSERESESLSSEFGYLPVNKNSKFGNSMKQYSLDSNYSINSQSNTTFQFKLEDIMNEQKSGDDLNDNTNDLNSIIDSELLLGSNKSKYLSDLGFGGVQGSSWMSEDNDNILSDSSKVEAAAMQRQKMSEFGLISNANSSSANNNNNDNDNNDCNKDNNADSNAPLGSPSKTKLLFADDNIDVANSSKPSAAPVQLVSDAGSYQNFMNKMALPENNSLMNLLRSFIYSILGPAGDGSPPPPINATRRNKHTEEPPKFYGIENLSRRCNDFFDALTEHLPNFGPWKGYSEEQLIFCRDCIERYVMTKIFDLAFKSVEVPEEDAMLTRRMKLLTFLSPDSLDIKPELQNDIIWALARDKLNSINSYKTPADKINCVLESATILLRYLNLARAKAGCAENIAGADDFLPLFIWVVLRSHVWKLASNCEYIQAFHNPDHLRSKAGYFFVNLRSAMEFALSVEADSTSMDPAEFNAKLQEAEALLNKEELRL